MQSMLDSYALQAMWINFALNGDAAQTVGSLPSKHGPGRNSLVTCRICPDRWAIRPIACTGRDARLVLIGQRQRPAALAVAVAVAVAVALGIVHHRQGIIVGHASPIVVLEAGACFGTGVFMSRSQRGPEFVSENPDQRELAPGG